MYGAAAMDDLSSRLASLSPAKRKLFARRARESQEAALMQVVPRRDESGPAPLTLYQDRLWFLDQLQQGSAAYNVYQALRLRGAIDIAALREAFCELLARHESLRTSFSFVAGRPMQVVAPSACLDLPVVDLTGSPADLREEEAGRLVAEETQRPFDLASGPLLRALLIRLAQAEHILTVTTHHMISDGWSMAVLFMDLSYYYRVIAAGEHPVLAALPIQYGDFAAWQRKHLRGEVLERQVSYWRETLRGSQVLPRSWS